MNLQELNELDFENIGSWPAPAKIVLMALLAIAIGAGGYFYLIADSVTALEQIRNKENELKTQFEMKAALASNLEAYQKQMIELQSLLQAQLRQLPDKNEVAGLLDDISFIAMDNGLKLQRINWEPEVTHEFSTELPMKIEVTGNYNQLGKFAADIAALPRIVILDSFTIVRDEKNDQLAMSMMAKTYRYNEKPVAPNNSQKGGK